MFFEDIQQPFILDKNNEITLLEQLEKIEHRRNIFDSIRARNIITFSSNLFSLVRNNEVVQYCLGDDLFFPLMRDEKIFDTYKRIDEYKKNEIEKMGAGKSLEIAKSLLDTLSQALTRDALKRSNDEKKEFFYRFISENSKNTIKDLSENHIFNYIARYEIDHYENSLRSIFASTNVQMLLTGDTKHDIKKEYDLEYLEKLEEYSQLIREPESYYSRFIDNLSHLSIWKVVLMKHVLENKFEGSYVTKLGGFYTFMSKSVTDIPYIILKELNDSQLKYMSEILKKIDNKVTFIDLEMMRRNIPIESSAGYYIHSLREFLIGVSIWPTEFEPEIKKILELIIDNYTDSGILQRIIDLSKELDALFPNKNMRLIYLVKDKITEFIGTYFKRDITFDYFRLNYLYDNMNIFNDILAGHDNFMIYYSEFFSEANKLKIMLNVIFRDKEKNISEELLAEAIKYGLEIIIGPAIASEKRRFIRMFSSLLHEKRNNIGIEDRAIRLFFTELSKMNIRKTVLEKMFKMPDIIERNRFLEYSEALSGVSFFLRDYTDLLSIINGLNIQNSIKSTILLLILQ